MTTKTEAPATYKQVQFLTRLCNERPQWAMTHDLHQETIEEMGKRTISTWIDQALSTPKESTTPEAQPKAEVPTGIHLLGDTILKVVRGRQGGNLYTKALHFTPGGERWWSYEGKAPLAHLSAATMMTLEQMAAHGHHTGTCIRCDAELSDPTSVAQGMGPVCIKRAAKELKEAGRLQ